MIVHAPLRSLDALAIILSLLALPDMPKINHSLLIRLAMSSRLTPYQVHHCHQSSSVFETMNARCAVNLSTMQTCIAYLIQLCWQIIPDIVAANAKLQLLLRGLIALPG